MTAHHNWTVDWLASYGPTMNVRLAAEIAFDA
jgi:hypothetical protein